MLNISGEVRKRGERAEAQLRDIFLAFDKTAEIRTEQILEAFARHRVSEAMFAGSTGYGYDDLGRSALEAIYADVFGTEAGLVRIALRRVRAGQDSRLGNRRAVRHDARRHWHRLAGSRNARVLRCAVPRGAGDGGRASRPGRHS